MTTSSFIEIAIIITLAFAALVALIAVLALIKRLALIFLVVVILAVAVPAAGGSSIHIIEVCELLKPLANPCQFLYLLEWVHGLK